MPAQQKYLFWLYLKILSSFLSFTWSHHCAATRRRADLLGKSEPLCFEEKVFYISVIHSGFSDSSKFLFGIIRTSFEFDEFSNFNENEPRQQVPIGGCLHSGYVLLRPEF